MRAHPVTKPTRKHPDSQPFEINFQEGHPLDRHGVNISTVLERAMQSWAAWEEQREQKIYISTLGYQYTGAGLDRGGTKKSENQTHLSISHSSVSGLRANSVGLSLFGAG